MSVITQQEEPAGAEENETSAPSMWSDDLIEWLSSPVHLFLVMVSLLPVLLMAALVARIGVNMPFEDEWQSSAEIAIHAANGTLTPADIFLQSNEHRTVPTFLEIALLVPLNRWNLATALYFNVAVTIGTLLVCLALARRERPPILALVLVPFSAILFSYRQNANWSMSFQIGWFTALFCFALALWVLRHGNPGWRPLVVAALLATVMLFST